MNTYRSLTTIEATQFTGAPIPEMTCGGSPAEVQANGCDSSRKQHLHVHTQAIGGMTVLQPGDWIFPMPGGPWGVASDAKFRAHWEVPMAVGAVEVTHPETATFPEAPAIPPVDMAVVPAKTISENTITGLEIPLVGPAGPLVGGLPTHNSDGGPVAAPQIISVPVPHTVACPDTAVGEGLVTPSNPAIFTD